jgi:hypothetical protein
VLFVRYERHEFRMDNVNKEYVMGMNMMRLAWILAMASMTTGCGSTGGGDTAAEATGSEVAPPNVNVAVGTETSTTPPGSSVAPETPTTTTATASTASDAITAAVTARFPDPVSDMVLLAVDHFMTAAISGPGAQEQVSNTCLGGGTMTATRSATATNTWSAGDSLTVSFNNCEYNGVAANGAINVNVASYNGYFNVDGDFIGKFDITVSCTNFQAIEAGTTLSFNGSLDLDVDSSMLNSALVALDANSMNYQLVQ